MKVEAFHIYDYEEQVKDVIMLAARILLEAAEWMMRQTIENIFDLPFVPGGLATTPREALFYRNIPVRYI